MEKRINIAPNRKKILEAIVYFSKMLKNPSKTMMFKVLAELDYRHFLETGIPVTNLEYFAWNKGPVAKDFYFEISDKVNNTIVLPDDFKSSLVIDEEMWSDAKGIEHKTIKYKAKRKANLDVFSPRQQKILEQVAFIYKTATAKQASDASHEKDTPWRKTIELEGKEGALIDFLNILPKNSNIDKEEVKERMNEISAFMLNYGG